MNVDRRSGSALAKPLSFLGVVASVLVMRTSVPLTQSGSVDADGDGIPDSIETAGIDYTLANGTKQHLDLKALGASPSHKDVLVWIDWMGQADAPIRHDHKPLDSALQIVKNAFAASLAPTSNPDGRRGINLIVVVSPSAVPHQAQMGNNRPPYSDSIWSALDAVKSRYFPKELAPYFHYCLFAHDIALGKGNEGTSGLARCAAFPGTISLCRWEAGRAASGAKMNRVGRSCTSWGTT